jgi:hypothetical protein
MSSTTASPADVLVPAGGGAIRAAKLGVEAIARVWAGLLRSLAFGPGFLDIDKEALAMEDGCVVLGEVLIVGEQRTCSSTNRLSDRLVETQDASVRLGAARGELALYEVTVLQEFFVSMGE